MKSINTTEPSIGLGLKQRDNALKCYKNDTGDVERDSDYLYLPLYLVPCL